MPNKINSLNTFFNFFKSSLNKSSRERSLAPKAPLWLLALNMGCGTLGITIISPALGLVTNDFGVDEATGQWVLSAYFGAIALVQLFYGPLSDRFGRKIPLLSGLTLYGRGGVLGVYAPSIETLIAARVIQGLGGGSIISIIRAIINDSYERLEAAGAFALISGIMVVVPIFSFISGDLLGEMIGWQETMFLIGIAGGIAGILNYFYLHETNLYKLKKLNPLGLFRNYIEIYLDKAKNINSDMTVMCRQLSPTPHGIPLEIYAFSNNKEWKNYEHIMSDIFDHLIASLSNFQLELSLIHI